MPEAYIVEAVRTAGGRRGGRLAGVHPVDLAARSLDAIVERSGIDPKVVDDVVMGCVSQGGEQAMQVGRNAVLASKHLGEGTPAVTIDRQCGSSQQAVQFAAQAVMSGTQDVVIASGVESMSRVPMGSTAIFHMKEGLGNYKSPGLEEKYPGIQWSQFMGAEMIAKKHGFTKDDLDRFALGSHQKAILATESGAFKDEIVPVPIETPEGEALHTVDEGIRFDATLESIASVKLLSPDGIITAATSSQICDGSSAVLVVSEEALRRHGLTPMARIHNLTVTAGDPVIMLEEPLFATDRALVRAGMKIARHRSLRGQRGLRAGAARLAQAYRGGPGQAQRQWRRDRTRPPAGRIGHQAYGDAGPCAQGARQAIRSPDHVRGWRRRQCHHNRSALTPRVILAFAGIDVGIASPV